MPVYRRAYAVASLAPTKDMEVIVTGDSLESTDFQQLIFVALRALIDKLGAAAFNVGIFNIRVLGSDSAAAASPLATDMNEVPLLARCVCEYILHAVAKDFSLASTPMQNRFFDLQQMGVHLSIRCV